MKVLVTEQQLKNIFQNSDFNPDTDAPNLTKFMKALSSDDIPMTTSNSSNSLSPEVSPNIPKGNEMMHPLGHKKSITSQFGYRVQPLPGATSNHQGIDIECPSGSPVYAPMDGFVIASRDTTPNACGGIVMLDHGNIETKFCHLRQMLVKRGDNVKKGQVIAYSGGGKNDPHPGITTGPHLHYEILNKSGIAMNPLTVQRNLA